MKPKTLFTGLFSLVVLFGLAFGTVQASPYVAQLLAPIPLDTSFTYQGYLVDSGRPASGVYDFQFRLYDNITGTGVIGSQVDKSNVSLSNGYFTVTLDFGSAAFAGDKRWLEIDVTPDGSGSWDTLTPRQELTASPYALYSLNSDRLDGQHAAYYQRAVINSCPSDQAIRLVNSDGTTTCVNFTASLGVTKVGTDFRADTSYVQRRVSGSCVAGKSIRVIKVDGTVDCEDDDNTTYTGTNGVSVVGTVISADTTYVQRRVSQSCRIGSTIRVIKADGTVDCWDDAPLNRPIPPTNQNSLTLPTLPLLDWVNQVTIGADGLPLILFSDPTDMHINVAHCGDMTCTTATYTHVDDYQANLDYASFAIDPAGRAVIAYYEFASQDLWFGRCADTTCTSVATHTVLPAPPPMVQGQFNDITIAADGNPLITFLSSTMSGPDNLLVVHCGDADCNTLIPPAWTIVDPGPVLQIPDPSITLGADGKGLIAYHHSGFKDLMIAHCNDQNCTGVTLLRNNTSLWDGYQPSITTGTDALGLVAYLAVEEAGTPGNPVVWHLETAHCSNGNCSAAVYNRIYTTPMPTPVFPPYFVPWVYPSTTIGPFGLGSISFNDFPPALVVPTTLVASCNNLACSAATFSSALGGSPPSAITISPTGNPLISHDSTTNVLMATLCGDPFCTGYYRRR